MTIQGSPRLTLGLLLKKKENRLFQWMKQHGVKDYSLFGYSRVALLDGLKILNCGKGDNVLLPSYICDVVIDPFYELGIEIRFYKVLTNLQPDITDIKTRIDRKTKAILAVNYFGFPQRLDEIQSICKEYGIALIEDNAHGFLSRKNSRLLGTFGDIGFSNFWKNLPVPNGAVLYVNNEQLIEKFRGLSQILPSRNNLRRTNPSKNILYPLGSLLAYLEVRYRFPAQYFVGAYSRVSSKGERDPAREYENFKVRISGFSLRVLQKVDPEEVVNQRRENYGFWLDRLYGKGGVTVIFEDLPEGVCPQVFPMIADDVDSIEQKLLSRGIYIDRWPWLPKEVEGNKEYPTANFLARHLRVLAVHQNTDPDHLQKAAEGLDLP